MHANFVLCKCITVLMCNEISLLCCFPPTASYKDGIVLIVSHHTAGARVCYPFFPLFFSSAGNSDEHLELAAQRLVHLK